MEERESMNHGLSDQVRTVALKKYVHPAILAGRVQFSVAVRDLMRDLKTEGFPAKNWPQVCTAIQAEKFLRENGLEIEGIDGPPSKTSTTVVVRYRLANSVAEPTVGKKPQENALAAASEETPEEWAHRLTAQISGLLKEELAEYGGGEAFLRWVRGYDEEDAA